MAEKEKKAKEKKLSLALNKPVGGKKGKYPSRTAINLVYRPENTQMDVVSLGMFLVFLLILAAGTKFLVIDLLSERDAAEHSYREKERTLQAMVKANDEYDEVEAEYSRYGISYMTEEELNRQYRTAMLEVIDEKISKNYGFQKINISGNTATLVFEVDELSDVSEIVGSLNTSPLVSYVTFTTATQNEDRVQSRDIYGNVQVEYVRTYLNANITVHFKTLTEAVDALTEEGGEAS